MPLEPPKARYSQIAEMLRARIEDGSYLPGSALPSESDLAAEFGVTRPTVNRAVGMLRMDGLVKVRRGAGTYVRELPRILRDARQRYSSRRQGTGAADVEARALNLEPRTDYTEIGKVEPPESVAKILGLGKGQQTLVRRRRLFVNDVPTQLADSYIPWSIAESCPELQQPVIGGGGSYAQLAQLGHAPVRFTEDVTVRAATDEEARLLDLDGDARPVFDVVHVAWTAGGRPVEVALHVMAGHLWTLRYDWSDEPVEPVQL